MTRHLRQSPGVPALMLVLCLGTAAPGPATANPSNRELVEITDIDSLSASPDGRFAVFRTERASVQSNGYRLEWYAVDLRSGSVRRIADGGQAIYDDPGLLEPSDPVWLPDGASVAFRALVDGSIGVWKASVSGDKAAALIVRDADVEQMSLSADGRALVYRVGPSRAEIERAERQEYDSGIRVDASVDLAQSMFRGGSVNGRMASQRLTGYWYTRSGLLWRAPRQERRYDFASGRDEAAGGVPAPAAPGAASDANEVARASTVGEIARATWDGFSGSLTFQRQGGGPRTQCVNPLCATRRISSLGWRPGTHELLVTFTDRQHRQSLDLWDVATNRLRPLISADGLLAGGRRNALPCAVTSTAALCVEAAPASPPRLVEIGLDTGDQKVLFDPNVQMRADYRARVEFLSFRGQSGTDFAGLLLTPGGAPARRAPLFVNYYDCDGFLRGGEGDEWPIPALLDSGFVVACLNSPPFKGEQNAVQTYRTGLEGVRALISLLADRGLVDSHKVAMGGLSFGSEVAMWVAIYSKLLGALSVSSAQVEPAQYWLSAQPGTDHAYYRRKVWGLGRPEETPRQWRLVSPAMNAKRITVPTLFQLPEQEARQMPELYARLVAAGTPTELYAFPDEAHVKIQPRHRMTIFDRNLDWFRYWLQDYRDPDPTKAEQYRRWDRLRPQSEKKQASSASIEAIAQARPAR
jgi:dipeptidyl aminopeptidase/acylaminoacyl peptidase